MATKKEQQEEILEETTEETTTEKPKTTKKTTKKATTEVDNLKVAIELLDENTKVPEYMTEGAGCADIYLPHTVALPPVAIESRATEVSLGFKVVVPKGYTMRIQLRSSVGRDCPIALANTEGIIDEDFRGEVKLFLRNFGRHLVMLEAGQRIAQCWLEKKTPMEFEEVEVVAKDTERGTESGSTGK